MGVAWALFMPILTVMAGLVVRAAISHNAAVGGEVPSLAGIAIKSWAWTFFAGAMSFATMSILANAQLVTKIFFAKEVLPLSCIATQCVDSLLSIVVLVALGPWLGFHWSVQLFWVPVLVALLVIFTTGVALLFACANLFFRDVKYILQVLLMFGIFFTPVFFDPEIFSPRVASILFLNPLSPILVGLEHAVSGNAAVLGSAALTSGPSSMAPWHLAYAAAVSVAALLVGMIVFRKSAANFAEYY